MVTRTRQRVDWRHAGPSRPPLIDRRRVFQGAIALLVSGCAAGGPDGIACADWADHDPASQQQVDAVAVAFQTRRRQVLVFELAFDEALPRLGDGRQDPRCTFVRAVRADAQVDLVRRSIIQEFLLDAEYWVFGRNL